MKELTVLNNEKVNTIDTREIAEMMEVDHAEILKKLEGTTRPNGNTKQIGIIPTLRKCNFSISKYFIESEYKVDGNNKTYKCYLCTLKGIKLIIDHSRKTPKMQSLIDWYNSQTKTEAEIIVLKSRFEDSFINKLEETLKPLGYILEKQKPLFERKYILDGYIPELNIAIEYDEGQHFTPANQMLDKQREKEIRSELNCRFVRCDFMDTDAYNIGLVIKEIIKGEMF